MLKRALIIGGAENAIGEALAALELFTPDATFLVNDAIPRWGNAQFLVSLHGDQFKQWIGERVRAGYWMQGVEVWSHRNCSPSKRPYEFVQHVTTDWGDSSGLFAVNVARLKHYNKIVLAGIPMAAEGGHIVRKRPWTAVRSFLKAWKTRQAQLAPYVRSMSGFTKELFGAPSKEWFEEDCEQ